MPISRKIYSIALFGLLGVAVAAANASAETANPTGKTTEQSASSTSTTAQALENVSLKGKVLETMNASGYTYLLIDSQKGKVWAAIPETTIAIGQEVVSAPGMVMLDFTSKTLNRSFAQIVFSPGLETDAADAAKSAAAPQPAQKQTGTSSFADALAAETAPGSSAAMGAAAGDEQVMGQQNSGGSAGAIAPAAAVQVDKATGSNSYTVGEIFGQPKELSGKTVRVRGKVVKNSRMIMGKNWLHLQDGTGEPDKKQHDLVVTTMADATEGEIVTVEGVVAANRDFGAGYNYQVLIENAKVEKQ